MKILHFLTLIFVVLKLTDLIAWSWWLVVLPSIISVGLYILIIVGIGIFAASLDNKRKRF